MPARVITSESRLSETTVLKTTRDDRSAGMDALMDAKQAASSSEPRALAPVAMVACRVLRGGDMDDDRLCWRKAPGISKWTTIAVTYGSLASYRTRQSAVQLSSPLKKGKKM